MQNTAIQKYHSGIPLRISPVIRLEIAPTIFADIASGSSRWDSTRNTWSDFSRGLSKDFLRNSSRDFFSKDSFQDSSRYFYWNSGNYPCRSLSRNLKRILSGICLGSYQNAFQKIYWCALNIKPIFLVGISAGTIVGNILARITSGKPVRIVLVIPARFYLEVSVGNTPGMPTEFPVETSFISSPGDSPRSY